MLKKRLKKCDSFLAVAVCAAALITIPFTASARIKCWTNEDGVRECGNVVPPEYAQHGHKEISDRGITVKETQRAKTKEEIEQERAEKARLAAEQAEKDRLEKIQAERDRVLLYTFATEEDLELARIGKLRAIESKIRHAQTIYAKLESSLDSMTGRAAVLERSGKPIPDQLQREIAHLQRQIGENRDFIRARRAEQAAVDAKFDADRDRYRHLKGTAAR